MCGDLSRMALPAMQLQTNETRYDARKVLAAVSLLACICIEIQDVVGSEASWSNNSVFRALRVTFERFLLPS